MSFRIHKSLGYGLDLKSLDYVVDPDQLRAAINNEETDLAKELENFYHDTVSKKLFEEDPRLFLERYYLKELQIRNESVGNLFQYIQYDDEFGDENFVQFIPTEYVDRWKRYDDDIDYVEWDHSNDNYAAQVQWKDFPIYPFMELMRKNDEKLFGIERYMEPFWRDKFKIGQITEMPIPSVPIEVMGMMHVLGVFPKDKLVDTFLKLRPSIYMYWA